MELEIYSNLKKVKLKFNVIDGFFNLNSGNFIHWAATKKLDLSKTVSCNQRFNLSRFGHFSIKNYHEQRLNAKYSKIPRKSFFWLVL